MRFAGRFVDLTAEVAKFAQDAKAREGAVTLFIRHTSASLTIQENADPSVLRDLMTALDRFAPENAGWSHDTEGPDDMPAHVNTMLTATSLHVPVLGGDLALGTWQAIYLIEHRARPQPQAKKRVLRAILDAYYVGIDKPVVFDKCRGWVAYIEMAEEILGAELGR